MEQPVHERKQFPYVGVALVIVAFLVVGAVILPIYQSSRISRPDPRGYCLSNLKQIGTAVAMYERDWDETLPALSTLDQSAPEGQAWPDALMPYIRNEAIFSCSKSDGRLTYSFNRRLSGLKLTYEEVERDDGTPGRRYTLPASQIVLIYESVSDSPENNNLNGDTVWHAVDGLPQSGMLVAWPERADRLARKWPDWAKPRHEDVTHMLYLDGHVSRYPGSRLNGFRFSPE